MKKRWCRWFGHRWQAVWTNPVVGTYPCLVCLRCRENGWMVTR